MEDKQRHYFHPVDYVLLALSLVTSLGVGFYQAMRGRKHRTTSDYLMGGRKFHMLPVAMSLVASFISSIALIGLPAEVHFYGMNTIFSFIGCFIGTLLAATIFVPLFHPLGITSVQEYLEMRFHSRVLRLFGTFLCIVSQLFYTGCVVYGQSAALEATTGLPYWSSILIVNVLGTIYTASGGMKAVIWTDVFQVSVMFISMVIVIIIGMVQIGGPRQAWEINEEWGRLHINWELGIYSRMTFWSTTIATMVGWTNTYSITQTSVQRYCAVPDVSKARRSMVMNAFGTSFFCLVCAVVGMVTFAFYAHIGCDPYADGVITNKNQILPFFIMEVLSYPGLPGLFVSGLFSGSLSTISSNINSVCAVVWEDIFKPQIGHRLPANKQVTVNQIIAAAVGVLGLGMTFIVHHVGGSLLQIAKSLFGLVGGPSLGIFMLGSMVPWCNWIGALAGGITSMVCMLFLFIGQIYLRKLSTSLPLPTEYCHLNSTDNGTLTMASSTLMSVVSTVTVTTQPIPEPGRSFLDEWIFSISFMWYGVIGISICLTVGVLVSLITGVTDPSSVEKRLLVSFVARFYGKETKDNKAIYEKSLNQLLPSDEKHKLEKSEKEGNP